jgi:hypothetical protein
MALDRQIDFTGGLNTRVPAHKLPENMVQAAINTDFSHGDVRPDIGIGGDGGGKQFFYEKGGSWVGTDLANAYTILVIDAGASSTEASNTNLGNPLTIRETGTYQVGTLFTFTAATSDVLTANATHGITNGSTVQVSSAGLLPKGISFTFTVVASTDVITTHSAHGLSIGDQVRASSTTTLPAGLTSSTSITYFGSPVTVPTIYFVKTVPSTTTLTLSAVSGGTTLDITNTGSGTHSLWHTNRSYYVISASGADLKLSLASGGTAVDILDTGSGIHNIWATSGTVANTITVNDTELNLGSVTSFVEYNEDLYMGRENFSLVATTLTVQTGSVTLTAADVAKVIVSDSVVGTGVPLGAKIESIDYGTNIVTLDKTISTGGSGVTLTINTAPARIIDGVLTKIFPLEIPKPDPQSVVVSQLPNTNTTRAVGHSLKWITQNFPIPMQWGIARFDDTTGAEGGISELTTIGQGIANINSDNTHTNVPAMVKYKINKQDANALLYGKFALYRVGGTSSVVKKVEDILLTSQSDGTPLSVIVGVSTNDVTIDCNQLPTGAEWKAKWYGFGATGAQRSYHSGGIESITITNDGAAYVAIPIISIAVPGGSGKRATAKAVLTGGSLTNIIITDKGSGYGSAPVVTIDNAPTGSDHATGTAVIESASVSGETSLLTTNSPISLYGSNAHHDIDLHFCVKFTSDNINDVTGKPYSDDTREYVFASTSIEDTDITGDNGDSNHAGCGSYIDFTPPRALIEIEPVDNPTKVPYDMKYLTEFNNFFMGAVDTKLYISNYAKPNNYAIDGYLDFDSQITGIVSRGGEAVVFTEFGVYRVYGNAHNEMRKVEVPTVHGIPIGGHKTISKIKDSVIYVSHTGICLFDGRSVTVLTDNLIQNFAKPSENTLDNVSGVIDNTYYLLADGSDGWKVDMKQGLKICKSTGRASNFHYRGNNNKLFTEAGYVGGGTENKYSFQTRDFTGGNITSEKAYYTVYVTGTDFSGTVNIKCDGSLTDTFNFSSVISEFNRALYLSTAKVANRASVEFVDCSGQITSVSIKYDVLTEQQKKRFNFVTFTYTGTPTVTVKVDSVQKIASTVLNSPGIGNTGTSILYFPAMTEGYIPHIIADETETSRISGSVFDAEVI